MNNKLLEDARAVGFLVRENNERSKESMLLLRLAKFAELQQSQSLLSQGEPVAKKSRDQLFLEEQDTLRISKSGFSVKVGWQDRRIVATAPNNICNQQWLDDAERLCNGWNVIYETSPSTEALQKDKAELIEYEQKIRGVLRNILLINTDEKVKRLCIDAALIPQPKCMQ